MYLLLNSTTLDVQIFTTKTVLADEIGISVKKLNRLLKLELRHKAIFIIKSIEPVKCRSKRR